MINVCLCFVTVKESMLVNVIACEIEESLFSFLGAVKLKEKKKGKGKEGRND